MAELKANEIISIIKEEIQSYTLQPEVREYGTIVQTGDGIATIYGLENAAYGEIVAFEGGSKGIVMNIEQKTISCIVLDAAEALSEGGKAYRTGKTAGVGVSQAILGRVVNALGEPVDGKGPIAVDAYRPVENPAPYVVERQPISAPLQTGILAIDAMIPVGRGQRELIIGDRQTGKTSIAIDTILAQKGQGVVCVYVAIGQKASTVSRLVATLEKYGALEYTVVVASTASDSAPQQYIAPYAGTAIAEYFMHKGQDALIVYDDLSKHAAAYRAISLLLKRPPGREAYPGDVFYLHSRLLERAAKLSPELGGGSLTALPIIETLAGDISAYIPTNVISITDGQICLESELFFSGVRPAVNVGLSVSRVGGAAQTKAMKKYSGKLRIDLAQYRELEVFTQFGADIDRSTKDILDYGTILVEVLKQPTGKPMPLHAQILTLIAATHKHLSDIPLKHVRSFVQELVSYARQSYSHIPEAIDNEKVVSPELQAEIEAMIAEFKKVNTWQR